MTDSHGTDGNKRRKPAASVTRAACCAAASLLALLAAGQALAQNAAPAPPPVNAVLDAKGGPQGIDASFRVGVTYTDNINRSDADKLQETIPEVGFRLSVKETRPRLQARIESDLEYQDYVNHTYPNDVIGGFVGSALFSIVPERFGWSVQDNFGETRANALSAETPANRQNVNVFSTGPDFSIPLGDKTALALQGRWSKASFGQTVANNQEELGTLSLIRRLTQVTSISLNVSGQRVTYDESVPGVDNNYDVNSAYFQLATGGPRTALTLELGATVLHDFAGSKTQPLVHLTFARALSPRTKFTVNAGTKFSDAARVFRAAQDVGGVVLGGNDVVVGSDPLRSDYGAAAWVFTGTRTTFQLGVDSERERHERNLTLNRERTGASVNFGRQITPKLTFGVTGNYGRQDFNTANLILSDWLVAATMAWQMSRNLTLIGRVGRGQGDSNEIVAYNYVENRASLFLQYGRTH